MRAERYVLPVRQLNIGRWYRASCTTSPATGATVFIEPMSVVEIGNELKQLISAEKAEIEADI